MLLKGWSAQCLNWSIVTRAHAPRHASAAGRPAAASRPWMPARIGPSPAASGCAAPGVATGDTFISAGNDPQWLQDSGKKFERYQRKEYR